MSFCEDRNVLNAFYFLKNIILLIQITVPIILIVIGMIDMTKSVISDGGKIKENSQIFLKRLMIGAVVFLVPLIIDMTAKFVDNFEYTKSNCWTDATKEKLEELKQQELLEKRQQELEEKQKQLEEAQKKRKSQLQEPEDKKENPKNNTKLIVENDIFYLPNKRATSDKDIPKGTGQFGLNETFANKLTRLLQDAKKAGYTVTVSSGWRSYSKQKETWLTSQHKCNTKWVACPGGSRHGFGIAADLRFDGNHCSQSNWNCNKAAKWVHDNAKNYGLKFRLSNEPWHIEPENVVGGNFGACTAPCS